MFLLISLFVFVFVFPSKEMIFVCIFHFLVYMCVVKPIGKCIKKLVFLIVNAQVLIFMEFPMLCGSKVIYIRILVVVGVVIFTFPA